MRTKLNKQNSINFDWMMKLKIKNFKKKSGKKIKNQKNKQ